MYFKIKCCWKLWVLQYPRLLHAPTKTLFLPALERLRIAPSPDNSRGLAPIRSRLQSSPNTVSQLSAFSCPQTRSPLSLAVGNVQHQAQIRDLELAACDVRKGGPASLDGSCLGSGHDRFPRPMCLESCPWRDVLSGSFWRVWAIVSGTLGVQGSI